MEFLVLCLLFLTWSFISEYIVCRYDGVSISEKNRGIGYYWNLKDWRYWVIYGAGSIFIADMLWRVMP